jgi:hypothetical protein
LFLNNKEELLVSSKENKMVSEFCNRFEKLIKSLEGNEY